MKNSKGLKSLLLSAITLIFVNLAITTSITGCSKIETNNLGFCIDGKSAIKQAQEKNQNILIVATMEGDDLYSKDFIENVLKNKRFKDEIESKYTILQLDFSKKAYEDTVFNDKSTKKQRKIAEENAERMRQNTLLGSRLNLQVTPSVFLMTKDMYYITEVIFTTEEITNYDSFKTMLEKMEPQIKGFNEKIEKTKKGTKQEKLAAIDKIYEETDILYRSFIKDLIEEYITQDKNNETGLLSKYLMANADIESTNFFMAGDISNAVKIYTEIAEDKRLLPGDRQNAYYLAAYILAQSGTNDAAPIFENMEKAIKAYPEGPNTPSIEQAMAQMKEVLNMN